MPALARVALLAAFVSAPAFAQSRSAVDGLDLTVGRPLGGTLSTATSNPTIRKVRGGFGPLPDIDGRLADRIDQIDDVLNGRLTQVNGIAAERLDQVNGIVRDRMDQADAIVAGRIAQVGLVGGDLVRTASGEVQATLKVADSIVENRIAQIDDVAKKRIDQVDAKVGARLTQVQGIATTTLREADGIVEARIEQVDEVAGRRLGNVDTIVSKQLISVESLLLKVPCVIGLVVALVWLAINSLRAYNEKKANPPTKAFAARKLGRWALESVLVFAAAGAFYWIGLEVPGGSQLRARELRMGHSRAFSESLERLDLTSARFHASQLAFLAGTDTSLGTMNFICKALPQGVRRGFQSCLPKNDDEPLDEAAANSALARVTLLRDVLITPSALTTRDGRAQVLERIGQLELLLDTADADPVQRARELAARNSLDALSAVVRFHGATDVSELPALVPPLLKVCDESKSVMSATQVELANRVFGDLACDTLRELRLALPSREWRVAAGLEVPDIDVHRGPYERVYETFRAQLAVAHVALLDAQLETCRAGGASLAAPKDLKRARTAYVSAEDACREARRDGELAVTLARRSAAAANVVKAWRDLLDGVRSANGEPDARSQLLLLDDAGLSFALAADSKQVLPPPLGARELAARATSFPPRVALVAEVFGERTRPVQALAAEVEARRFLAFETLEYQLLTTQLRGAHTSDDVVRLAVTLELKGLLGAAIASGWLGADELKKALAETGPAPMPIRRLTL
ncbi:MAG: hypothetical protein U0228_00105 [Myxococcaceae bacterium]